MARMDAMVCRSGPREDQSLRIFIASAQRQVTVLGRSKENPQNLAKQLGLGGSARAKGAYPPQILICEPTLLALLGLVRSLSLTGEELEAVTEQNNLHGLARESCL